MKHLKRYKIFENATSIIDNVNDMLFELNDEGFKCRVSEGLTPDLLPPVIINNVPKGYKLVKTHDIINVLFIKESPGFELDDVIEVYWRIKSYLTDNGYIEDVNFEGLDFESAFKKRKEDNKKIMGAGKTTQTGVVFMKPI
jgi:hypothetical protein